jgi:hypothetical protein
MRCLLRRKTRLSAAHRSHDTRHDTRTPSAHAACVPARLSQATVKLPHALWLLPPASATGRCVVDGATRPPTPRTCGTTTKEPKPNVGGVPLVGTAVSAQLQLLFTSTKLRLSSGAAGLSIKPRRVCGLERRTISRRRPVSSSRLVG